MTASRTIYLVDSDNETRRTLAEISHLMQIPLVTFSHGSSFLRSFEDDPGCLVAELRLEDMSGIELQQRIAQSGSKLPIMFVTAAPEVHLVVRAMQNGATTVLEKPVTRQDLWEPITKALALDREIRRIDSRHRKRSRRLAKLTAKEQQVLNLMMAGLPNKTIAKRLGVSLRTVESRRQKIFQKTKSDSLAQLMKLVILSSAGKGDASE